MGTYLRVLSESFLKNTNMTGLRWFSKMFAFHVLWTKVASALEGLKKRLLYFLYNNTESPLSGQANPPHSLLI